EIPVEREQRVVDEIAEIPRDIGRRPDWVEAAEIGLRNEPQGRLGNARGWRKAQGQAQQSDRKSQSAADRHRSPCRCLSPRDLTRSVSPPTTFTQDACRQSAASA